MFSTLQNSTVIDLVCFCKTVVSLSGFPNRPEKMAKLPVLLGNLDVTIDNMAPDVTSNPPQNICCTLPDCLYQVFPQNSSLLAFPMLQIASLPPTFLWETLKATGLAVLFWRWKSLSPASLSALSHLPSITTTSTCTQNTSSMMDRNVLLRYK